MSKIKTKDEDGSSLMAMEEDDNDLDAADEAAGNTSYTNLTKLISSNDNDDDDMKYSSLSTSSIANKRPSLLKTSSNKRPSLKQRPSLQRSNSSFNQSIRNLRTTLQHSSSQSFR